jgi:hypothetical protein
MMEYVSTPCESGMVEIAAVLAAGYSDEAFRSLRAAMVVGRGDSDWDALGLGSPGPSLSSLESEVARVRLCSVHLVDAESLDLGKVLYTDSYNGALRVVAEFSGESVLGDGGTYLREFGLYVNADDGADSGDLAVAVRHSKVWWDARARLRKEIIVDARLT